MWYKLKRIMILVANTPRLPSEYQEVEYIQLTWTQYISSFRFPVNFRFTIKAAFDATTTYYNVYDTQSVSPMLWVDTSWRFEMNINYKSSEFTKNTFITVVSDATWANNIITIDGTQVISWTKVSTITQDTFLLHRWASDGFKWKIAYMLLEDGNTKVFELIPCYRKSDNVIWMYDLVNDQFYTNAWSWTFTKWNDVPDMVEKQVRPSGITLTADFRTQNLSDLQNAWWTNVESNSSIYTRDTNWLTIPSSSSNSEANKTAWVYYTFNDLSSNNIITIHATWYCARTYSAYNYQYNSAMFIWLWGTGAINDAYYVWLYWAYNSSSNQSWLKSGVNLNGSIVGTAMGDGVWWDVSMDVVINFKNKTVEYKTTTPINQTTTSTLTDAQIATAISNKNILVWIFRADYTVKAALYTASIKIE